MFFEAVWDSASALFFIKGRISFYSVTGEKSQSGGGAPSVLIAYGDNNSEVLKKLNIQGKYIQLDNQPKTT